MNRSARIMLGAILAAVPGCRSSLATLADEPRAPTEVLASSAPATPPPEDRADEEITETTPLSAEPIIALPVPGFHPAVASIPRRSTRPRPVLVATHGAGDRPERQCDVWRTTVRDRGFVLCPRGFPTNPFIPEDQTGYFYPHHHALGHEIEAALAALAARFPGEVDLDGPILAGFSQGAIMGALLLGDHPARFARAVLIEGGVGGFQEWSGWTAQRFLHAGGERVLLACGGLRCAAQAEATRSLLDRSGVEAKVLHVAGAGHSYGGAMEEAVRKAFPWVVEGDPRWSEGSE